MTKSRGGSGSSGKRPVSAFVSKLFDIVNGGGADLCHWDEIALANSGDAANRSDNTDKNEAKATDDTEDDERHGFVICSPALFSESILPKYFKSSNFSSFVRQLHFYDFHKDEARSNKTRWRFVHPYFRKGRADLLRRIIRKTAADYTGLSKADISALQKELREAKASVASLRSTATRMAAVLAQLLGDAVDSFPVPVDIASLMNIDAKGESPMIKEEDARPCKAQKTVGKRGRNGKAIVECSMSVDEEGEKKNESGAVKSSEGFHALLAAVQKGQTDKEAQNKRNLEAEAAQKEARARVEKAEKEVVQMRKRLRLAEEKVRVSAERERRGQQLLKAERRRCAMAESTAKKAAAEAAAASTRATAAEALAMEAYNIPEFSAPAEGSRKRRRTRSNNVLGGTRGDDGVRLYSELAGKAKEDDDSKMFAELAAAVPASIREGYPCDYDRPASYHRSGDDDEEETDTDVDAISETSMDNKAHESTPSLDYAMLDSDFALLRSVSLDSIGDAPLLASPSSMPHDMFNTEVRHRSSSSSPLLSNPALATSKTSLRSTSSTFMRSFSTASVAESFTRESSDYLFRDDLPMQMQIADVSEKRSRSTRNDDEGTPKGIQKRRFNNGDFLETLHNTRSSSVQNDTGGSAVVIDRSIPRRSSSIDSGCSHNSSSSDSKRRSTRRKNKGVAPSLNASTSARSTVDPNNIPIAQLKALVHAYMLSQMNQKSVPIKEGASKEGASKEGARVSLQGGHSVSVGNAVSSGGTPPREPMATPKASATTRAAAAAAAAADTAAAEEGADAAARLPSALVRLLLPSLRASLLQASSAQAARG